MNNINLEGVLRVQGETLEINPLPEGYAYEFHRGVPPGGIFVPPIVDPHLLREIAIKEHLDHEERKLACDVS